MKYQLDTVYYYKVTDASIHGSRKKCTLPRIQIHRTLCSENPQSLDFSGVKQNSSVGSIRKTLFLLKIFDQLRA